MTQAAADITTVPVSLGPNSYDIRIGDGLLRAAGAHLKPFLPMGRTIVIADETVAGLYRATLERALNEAGIKTHFIVLPPGEQTKSFTSLSGLMNAILETGIERADCLTALGGGVIGDLTGFAAAIALRGINFVQIPTTLLAQVDSSVGGKTGIDTPLGKNTVGAFHQPRLVLCDTGLLATLPERQLKAGYAEIVKYGLLGDESFLTWLEAHGTGVLGGKARDQVAAVARSCRMKAEIVTEDEKEKGRRALLNLGHTFGHALEAECGYSEDLLHGEAISIGMVWAAKLSHRLGSIGAGDCERIIAHLTRLGLPTAPADRNLPRLSPQNLLDHMGRDKKVSGGRLTFVLLDAIGAARSRSDIAPATVLAFLEDELS